jgi:hypothetical protein
MAPDCKMAQVAKWWPGQILSSTITPSLHIDSGPQRVSDWSNLNFQFKEIIISPGGSRLPFETKTF